MSRRRGNVAEDADDDMAKESRFRHLLKPIRDLAENWQIDIAGDLEEYMEELASIAISFDGGATSLNFAEAALLIQGSACVYSKKVEYLYALIFKVLDMISSKRERLARAPSSIVDGVDADAAGLAAEREESLLLLDDIVKPARNIDLIEPPLQPLAAADASMGSGGGTPSAVNAGVRTPGGGRLTSRAPLAMMASFGGGNDSFRVVTASVHASGALVLDESMGGRAVSGLVGARGRENATSSPTTAAPDDAEPGAVLFDSYGDGMSDGDGDQPDVDLMPGPPADAEDVPRARDLWALADPDDAHVVASRPFKRGRLPTAAALAPATAAAALATDFSEYVDATARRCVSMVAAAPHMAFGVLYALERSRRAARRRAAASAAATRAAAARLDAFDAAGDGADDDYGWYGPDVDGGDDNGCDDGGSGFEAAVPAAADAAPDVAPLSFDDAVGAHDATEGGSTYEALCRAHIERFMRGAHAFAAESQLSRRVATWQGRLEPMLAEEEARPAFDIRACGESIVAGLLEGGDPVAPFAAAAHAGSKYEVARMFLASLQLANSNSVEIIPGCARGEGVSTPASFKLRLIASAPGVPVLGGADNPMAIVPVPTKRAASGRPSKKVRARELARESH